MGDRLPSGSTRSLGTTIAGLTFRRGGGGGRLDCWKKCHVSKADRISALLTFIPVKGRKGWGSARDRSSAAKPFSRVGC